MAHAQWEFYGAAGLRHASMVEYDRNGRQLVEERGLLPGIELGAYHRNGDWSAGLAGEIYGGDISYDGHVQSGAGFSTDTRTRQIRVRADAARNITEATLLVAGIEWDYWRRDILGQGATLGMEERYRSWRLLAGAQTRVLQTAWADINLKGLMVASSPERLTVRFDNQIFDQADLNTKSAIGARFTLGVQPRKSPGIGIETDFEWMRIDRSDDAVLRKGGIPVGTLAQPEHVRKALGIKASYRF